MTQASRSFALGGSSRTGLLLAGCLAVVAGVLVFVAVRSASGSDNAAPKSVVGGSETTVVTAKSDIAARTAITADMLQLTRVPSNALLPGALGSTDLVVGRVARIPV